jgi:tetratricopeptide (TPR) repeat protein
MGGQPSHAASPKRRVAAARHPPGRRGAPGVWPYAAALVLLGSLAYANSLDGVFILDDFYAIVDNPDIRTPWSASLVRSSWGESAVLGRPLVALTFAANYSLHALDVRGYHAGNIAVHLLCALTLFGLIRRVGQSVVFAFVCASLWMLHPLNSEVVNYISQRTQSMMAMFYLLTIYCSVRAHAAARPWPWMAAAAVASVLGTLSKQSMVTIPLAILLVDYTLFFDSLRSAIRSRWRFYLTVTAASWLAVTATVLISPPSRSVGFSSGPSPWTYLLNQSVMITRYLSLAVWPRNLVTEYGYPAPYTLTDVLPQMVFISGLLALAVIALRYRRKLGLLGLWIFLTLGVTSSVAPIATEVGAERRMYLPLAALVVLGVAPFAQLSRHVMRHGRLAAVAGSSSGPPEGGPHVARAVAVGCAVLWIGTAAALGASTAARNREYSSALRLAEVTFERWPNAYTRYWLADELLVAGRREEAIAQLREAIRTDARAHFALGRVLFQDGHLREAREQLQRFVQLMPLRVEAVEARAMIARVLLTEGRIDEASEQLRMVLQMNPSFVEAHLGLAEVFNAQQRYGDAATRLRAYLAGGGTNPDAWTQLGVALARDGRSDEAIQALRRAIERVPDAHAAHRSLAAILLARNDVTAAFQHAERAVALKPGDAMSRDLLGVTLAAQGRLDLAALQFRESLRLDPANDMAREHLEEVLGQ